MEPISDGSCMQSFWWGGASLPHPTNASTMARTAPTDLHPDSLPSTWVIGFPSDMVQGELASAAGGAAGHCDPGGGRQAAADSGHLS